MTSSLPRVAFDSAQLCERLQDMPSVDLDELPFGVIGFDAQGLVARYNRYESTAAAFPADTVMGQHLFIELAPCLNNYLIAGRFEDAAQQHEPLDETMPYVLTFRMRPTRVRLRLLASPAHALRFILVLRATGGAS